MSFAWKLRVKGNVSEVKIIFSFDYVKIAREKNRHRNIFLETLYSALLCESGLEWISRKSAKSSFCRQFVCSIFSIIIICLVIEFCVQFYEITLVRWYVCDNLLNFFFAHWTVRKIIHVFCHFLNEILVFLEQCLWFLCNI